jgi:hypothetical protein
LEPERGAALFTFPLLGEKKEKKNNNSASIILNVHLSFLLCE